MWSVSDTQSDIWFVWAIPSGGEQKAAEQSGLIYLAEAILHCDTTQGHIASMVDCRSFICVYVVGEHDVQTTYVAG